MEHKKTEKASLENKKLLFTMIGLTFTLGITLLAFEWKSYDAIEIGNLGSAAVVVEEDVVIQTEQNTPPPPAPPAAPSAEIEIVSNDSKEVQEFNFSAEADDETINEEYFVTESTEELVEEKTIFIIVEESAGYPGGDQARQDFLRENTKYPAIARESGIQGVVYVTFVVERDGSLTDIKVLRGIGGGCDEEAMRVVKMMPKWAPGKQRGKPVRCQFNMPIKFTLAG